MSEITNRYWATIASNGRLVMLSDGPKPKLGLCSVGLGWKTELVEISYKIIPVEKKPKAAESTKA